MIWVGGGILHLPGTGHCQSSGQEVGSRLAWQCSSTRLFTVLHVQCSFLFHTWNCSWVLQAVKGELSGGAVQPHSP